MLPAAPGSVRHPSHLDGLSELWPVPCAIRDPRGRLRPLLAASDVSWAASLLDRWANEVDNRRELTFLLYVNLDWDASKLGGCLRLHPDVNRPGERTVDIEPIAGRIVVFESGKQMHEVLESNAGADRLALTLWVEYEDAWREPENTMMPSIKQ